MDRLPKWVPLLLIASGIVAWLVFVSGRASTYTVVEIPYSQLKSLIDENVVERLTFKGDSVVASLRGRTVSGPEGRESDSAIATVPPIGDDSLIPLLDALGVEYGSEATDDGITGWFSGILPWLILIAAYWLFWRNTYSNLAGRLGGREAGDFLTGSAKTVKGAPRKVTFDDVAGQDNAKREVSELVDFLRDPTRYTKLGAEPPRGVLLMGPPGTGKTLLARALAGESGVPFFHISASEFIEMFVGVGASRVRKMFEEAKKRAPAIIFIDELDSIGRTRGTGLGGGHDEREQTLNQILAEMDGFAGHEAVIVLAATNRPDVLDPALLRPGRFDRHVTLDLPDKDARRAILDVHCRKVPLADDVDLDIVAAGTPGFSGADIKNLVNEAAMASARAGGEDVTMRHFDDMRDKLLMGSVRTLAIQPEERHRLAVHEAGHTAAAHFLPLADPLYKVTLIPRGRALGGTHMLPEVERHTLPEDYLKDRLAVMLGGRAAERALLGTVSSGADDDIRQATQLAKAMVARWGMAEEIGPVDLRQSDDHPFLGREIAQPRTHSEASAKAVDAAVHQLIKDAEARADAIIQAHRTEIDVLINALEDAESLGRAEIEKYLGAAIEDSSAAEVAC
jgi:cell division protease FtsH